MLIGQFFIGLLFIIAGVLALKFNYRLTNSFSKNNIFEQKLGSGSTYLVFQIASVGAILWGIITMFGLGDNVLNFLLDPLLDILRTGR